MSSNRLETAGTNVINVFNYNMFSVPNVEAKIRSEVPFFKKLLQDNYYNFPVFNEYVSKIKTAWDSILNSRAKTIFSRYLDEYSLYRYRLENSMLQMQNMASAYNAENLVDDLNFLSVSPNISSLTGKFRTTAISKRRPIRRRRP